MFFAVKNIFNLNIRTYFCYQFFCLFSQHDVVAETISIYINSFFVCFVGKQQFEWTSNKWKLMQKICKISNNKEFKWEIGNKEEDWRMFCRACSLFT